jgi:hypothetical protein
MHGKLTSSSVPELSEAELDGLIAFWEAAN